MNLPPTQPPRRGQSPEATEHYIIACRSSALVLNREGCLQEALELWDLADQAEQDLTPDPEQDLTPNPDRDLAPDVLGRAGHGIPALLKAELARTLDNRAQEVSTWPAR